MRRMTLPRGPFGRRGIIRTRRGLLLDTWTMKRIAARCRGMALLFAAFAQPTGQRIPGGGGLASVWSMTGWILAPAHFRRLRSRRGFWGLGPLP